MPKKEGFFTKHKSKIKTWINRLLACSSFGLVTASVVGIAIPAGALIIPPSLSLIICFLVKHGPSSVEDIKQHVTRKLSNDEEALKEVIECLSDIQSKISSVGSVHPIMPSPVTPANNAVRSEPFEAENGNITQRTEMKLMYNKKTGNIEYVVVED